MFRASALPGSDRRNTLIPRNDTSAATDQNGQDGVNTKAPLCLLAGLPGLLVALMAILAILGIVANVAAA